MSAECSFCGWEDDDDLKWIETRKADDFGASDSPGRQDQALCGFCWRSFAAAAWLATGVYENAERDLLMGMNVLRALIMGRQVDR